MEFTVYDAPNRRAGMLVGVALIAGMIAAFATFFLIRGTAGVPVGSLALLFPMTMILVVFLPMTVMISVRIRVERLNGEMFRLFTLFGLEVRRQRFNISDFDRVSLSRGFRGGYRVSLVGREQDVVMLVTSNLATARRRAEEIAGECGLKLSDQL